MNRIHTTALALALFPFLTVTSGCDPKVAPVPAPPPVAPAIQPTAERAQLRAQERWAKGVKGDWVAVYDFHAPEVKRELGLAQFLGNMQMHRYENMKAVEVLAVQSDKAFVRTTGLWTPQGPQVSRAKLEPGQTLTQEITMIETWRFVDGDWCFVRPERDTDFFPAHPELLKKSGTVEGAPADPKAATTAPAK